MKNIWETRWRRYNQNNDDEADDDDDVLMILMMTMMIWKEGVMRKFCAVAVNGIKTGQSGRKPCRGKNILIFDFDIWYFDDAYNHHQS